MHDDNASLSGQPLQETIAAAGIVIMDRTGRLYSLSEPAVARVTWLLGWCSMIARRARGLRRGV